MIPFLQTAGAGALLFLLWLMTRNLRKRDELVWRIVAAGLVARAVAAQVLFWVSYANLPPGPLLQHSDGIWSFAPDAAFYLRMAEGVASPGELASPAYIALLGIFFAVAGKGVIAGVILNLFAFVATAHALVTIAAGGARRELRIACLVLSFSPAFFLWSLQPLKDCLVGFLLVAFVAACALCRGLLHQPPGTRRAIRMLAAVVVLALVTAMLAMIRWYAGVLLVGVIIAVMLAKAAGSRQRRHSVAALVAAPLVLAAFLGTFTYLGPHLSSALTAMAGVRADRMTSGHLLDAVPGRLRATRAELLVMPAASTMMVAKAGDERSQGSRLVIPEAAGDIYTAGIAVWLLPLELAELAGLAHVAGSAAVHLLMLVDTPVFTAVLLWAVAATVAAVRRGGAGPVTWIPLIAALALSFALVYVIPNAGTVVRHRSMVLLLLLTVPILARRAVEQRSTRA